MPPLDASLKLNQNRTPTMLKFQLVKITVMTYFTEKIVDCI